MLSLVILAGFGLCTSIIIHICMHLNLFIPPHGLTIAQNAGIGILFYAIAVISKKLRQGSDIREFNNAVLSAPPRWMNRITGTMIVYGIVVFIFCFYRAFTSALAESGVEITLNKFYKGLSALLMVFYVSEFSLLYSYRILKKQQEGVLPGKLEYNIEKYCGDKPEINRCWRVKKIKLNNKQRTIRKWGVCIFGVISALHVADRDRYYGGGHVNNASMFTWWAVIVIVTIVLVFAFRDKKKNDSVE